MTIDFTKEVHQRKQDFLDDLFSLLEIESVRDDEKATPQTPFGPGPVAALEKMLEIATRDGFATRNIDNYAGELETGSGEEVLGIFAHLDVVPAGNGWETAPFTPTIKENKLYARGASDDKGPTVAAYYGLKILKELGVPFNKKVRFVFGTDEESGWGDMEYYFQHSGVKLPDFGFSPDAEFPMINGEKGNTTAYLTFGGENGNHWVLHHFSGGVRENMVPEAATATFTAPAEMKNLQKEFENFLKNKPITGTFHQETPRITLKITGKSAHGAMPEAGVNAATYLAKFLASYDFQKSAVQFLEVAGKILWNDHEGQQLHVAHEDKKMGKLTMNAGIFRFEEGDFSNQIALNFRYPQGTTPERIKNQLEKTLKSLVQTIQLSDTHHTPHYVPVNDPLVKTLLTTYEDHTGQKGAEQVIGGGTFGRLLKRGVAYGAMFPHSVDTMHQANEFIDLDDLFNACAIYADAIYRLTR